MRGRGGGGVGPLEAQCRPFNDAASGKFVQIVYGYCTFIHTAEHTKRNRERERGMKRDRALALRMFGRALSWA